MRIRSHWVLSALVVILLMYIGYSEWRTRRTPPAEVETVGRFDPRKVEEVSFTVEGQTATVVREADGRWSLTQPFKDEADGPTILSILANLRELRIVRTVEAPDDLEQYGLTRPRVITVRERGTLGRTSHSYHLGEISPVHYVCPLDYWIYARREGEARVLVVEGYQINHLMPREPGDLRNRNLLSFNPHEIRRLEVTVEGASYAAVRTPKGWTLEGSAATAPPAYMREILFTLANLRAVRAEVKDDGELPRLGLDPPAAQVALYAERAEAVERLTFGTNRSQQGTVYVRRESTRYVYLVSSFILDELRKPALSRDAAGPRLSLRPAETGTSRAVKLFSGR